MPGESPCITPSWTDEPLALYPDPTTTRNVPFPAATPRSPRVAVSPPEEDEAAWLRHDPLLRASLETTRLGAGADNATFAVAERTTGHAVVVASAQDEPHALWRSRFLPGVGVAGTVLLTRRPLLVEDVDREPAFQPLGFRPVRSIAAVPVEADGQTLGVLSVTSASLHRFTTASADYLQAVAGQLALVVARAARVAHLERLRDLVHDLNTPLNALHGFLELALDYAPPLPRPQRELLDLAAVATDQLVRLVGDMRDSTYLSTGRLELRLAPIDPVHLARATVANCLPLANESGLRVTCVWRPHLPPIRADHRRVERILGNLLQNAMKFAPAGSTIQVGVDLDGPSRVRFTIEDEGPGLDEHEFDRLFEPLYQGQAPPARPTDGHGLGLSIARALATAHGGLLVAANRPTGGASFALVLPFDPAHS